MGGPLKIWKFPNFQKWPHMTPYNPMFSLNNQWMNVFYNSKECVGGFENNDDFVIKIVSPCIACYRNSFYMPLLSWYVPAQLIVQQVSKFQGRFKKVSRVFQGSLKGVSRKFEGCFKEVWRVFQGSFKKISRVFHRSFKGV